MRDKKLRQKIELIVFLVGLISILMAILPAANAQAPQAIRGIPYYYILVNAAVIALVLFALQAFLVPQKDGKERTAVWLAILAGSVIIAWNWGSAGYIWDVGPLSQFIKIKVVVNAIILTGVGWLLLGLFKVAQPQSPEGKAAYTLMIFLVAVLMALQFGDKWLWQEPLLQYFKDYLFSKEAGKEGILTISTGKLWIFLISLALYSFFFSGFLLKGGVGGSKEASIFLAVVLAAATASRGMSYATLSTLGEFLFLAMVQASLKEAGGFKFFGFPIALLIIGIASATISASNEAHRGFLARHIGCKFVPCEWGIQPAQQRAFVGAPGALPQRTAPLGGLLGGLLLGAGGLIGGLLTLVFPLVSAGLSAYGMIWIWKKFFP